MSQFGSTQRTSMKSLIRQLYKELFQQQKYLKREDIRNAKKSNQLLLRLVALLEKEIEENEKKSK